MEAGEEEAWAAVEQEERVLPEGLGGVAEEAACPIWEFCGLPAIEFGELTFGQRLGRGAFGAVYAAECPHFGGRVAAKVLTSAVTDFELGLLLNEAWMMALVAGHPNVLTFHALLMLDGRPVGLVTELATLGSLGDMIQGGSLPSPADALLLTLQLCAGLAHVHACGVLHQDIKPDNVLVCEGEGGAAVLKLADFGMAQRVGALRHAGGTQRYFSPGMHGRVVSEKSDVWALALTCAEMATGELPPLCVDGSRGRDDPIAVPASFSREWKFLSAALLVGDPALRPGAREMGHWVQHVLAWVQAPRAAIFARA